MSKKLKKLINVMVDSLARILYAIATWLPLV